MNDLNSGNTLRLLRPDEIPHILEEGELGAVLEWAVTRPDGKVVEHVVKKSESYVQAFLQLLFILMAAVPLELPISIRDTGNTLRNIWACFGVQYSSGGFNLDSNGGIGNTNYGIVVGTGVAAPTISDYALGTLIAQGVDAGQIQYSAMSFGTPGGDATTSQMTLTRNFTANVGGITINEIGLYSRMQNGNRAASQVRYCMTIRDVIGGGIVVGAGNTLTVNYRLQAMV